MSALTTGRCLTTQRHRATVTRHEKTEHENGARSWRNVPDHQVEADVEVWVDVPAILRQMAERAVLAKGKKAQGLAGAVVCRAVNHRRV